jgi:hypothetical protein
MGKARWRPKPPNEEEASKKQIVETIDMNLGFESPLPRILAHFYAQSGAAAAAWSGMWYGLAIGVMNAATRSTPEPSAPVPEKQAIAAAPPVALVQSAKPAGRKGGSSRR